MNVLLLSGGSGKRLWPLSNDVRSKQFLKIFKSASGYQSMIQRVYSQIKTVDKDSRVIIATSNSQVSSIRNQLSDDVLISIEPSRKDTFPAIALAALYLYDVLHFDKSEPIVICPVDPYVDDSYFKAFELINNRLNQTKANVVLMGIKPTYPSEKYGYIIPCDNCRISSVKSFKEKPDVYTAKEYIKQGALWNGGVFGLKLDYIINKAHDLIDFSDYYDLLNKYNDLVKISFDYAVLEKEKYIDVIRYDGEWKDLGTWNTLTEVLENNIVGNAVMNDSCVDVSIINELEIPILGMGLKNCIIAASPDGILVTNKDASSHIKPYVDSFEQKNMYMDKSWGNYKVIDVQKESCTILITLKKDSNMNYHCHHYRNEVWTIIQGNGTIVIDDIKKKVSAGDTISINAGHKHSIYADEELKIIEVQIGKDISAKDKIKFNYLFKKNSIL